MPVAWRLARRELRGGLKGFRIFFACLAVGVAAICGVQSLSDAILTGLSEQGRTLLGGDVEVHLVHRPTGVAEHAFLASRGRLSTTTSMRAMAYALKNGRHEQRQLVEIKAVDNAYPLIGKLRIEPNIANALVCNDRVCGAVVEQSLLDRLGLRPGGAIQIGAKTFQIRAVLTGEPDRIASGLSLGPHVIISSQALSLTGLVTLGSLIDYNYRIVLVPGLSAKSFKQEALHRFPEAGWDIRDSSDAAPGIRRFVEQVTMFLTLVSLTALAVAGVGASQAIGAFLDRKREDIGTLKSLGASGILIFAILFLQLMVIASGAVAVGLAIGAILPFFAATLFDGAFPLPAHIQIFPSALALSAAFGLLSAVVFSVPPLARAREIKAASLFRDQVTSESKSQRVRAPYVAAATAAGLAVVGLSLALSPQRLFAVEFLGGTVIILVALRGVGIGLIKLLKQAGRPSSPIIRLALGNLTRPGAGSVDVVTALGLGLTLLATVSILDHTIDTQLEDRLPSRAPSFFFVDIQPGEASRFDALIGHLRTAKDYKRTPMIRGRIVSLKGIQAKDVQIAPDAKWALAGDRAITYAADPPKGTILTEGNWWPHDYRGPLLISFDAELAKGMGLKLGDQMVLNVLGREISGKIASFRKVDFTTGGQNFIIVVSPGLIDHAPHSFLATVRVEPYEEEQAFRLVTDSFPNVSTIRVRDAIVQVDNLFQQLGTGVRAATLITILSGLLVLAGAVAAGNRARIYDATIFKVLGATRSRIAAVYLLEYGVLGLLTGCVALALGATAAMLICQRLFEVPVNIDLATATLTVLGGAAATLLFGLTGAFAALSARPASHLRAP